MGEFQKRIESMYSKEEWKKIDKEDPRLIHWLYESIPEIVASAKKEYPIWDNTDIESRLTGDVLLDLVKAKDKWHKKWFGNGIEVKP